MEKRKASLLFLVFSAVFLACSACAISGQTSYNVQSTQLTLYRDGLIHCEQDIVLDTLIPEITLPLISEAPLNVLLLDENLTAIDYEVVGANLTVYTLGARGLSVAYDTMQLTRKEAEVWTLNTNYPYNITVNLPSNSTIIYLSDTPVAIETTMENTISLSLTSGNWEISYVLSTSQPIVNPSPTSTPDGSDQETTGLKIEYLAFVAVAIGIAISLVFVYVKRRGPGFGRILKKNPHLGQEDQAVIQFLIDKGGKAFEAELREKFPNLPRTSLWRLVRRLERLDVVEIKKIGLENQVQLKK